MIRINESLEIPEEEVSVTASRSGGPGGQHVNKVNTRVTLWFDVADSPTLSGRQKQALFSRLGNRITKDGVLRIVSQEHRSQSANREAAVERFAEMLRGALVRPKKRRRTRPTFASRQRRLESKRRRSQTKRLRSNRDL
jgi:ribosome-associated protein